MKIAVKLYGTLRRRFPDYNNENGMEVEIPDEATIKELLAILKIPKSQGAVVVMKGRVLKSDDRIQCGAHVNVVQALFGG
jgi:sulfur carrier protein ThiS